MKRIFELLITLLLSVSSLVHADWEGYLLPDGFAHQDSLAKAIATANGSGRAVVVYYTRTNCPPCNNLQRRIRKEEVGAPYRDGYVFTAVWGSSMGSYERDSYRTKYWVQGAPTWIFFNRHGKYVCTAAGGFTSDEAGTQLHKTVQSLLATPIEGESAAPRSCS